MAQDKEEIITRAQQAKRIFDDEMFKECVKTVRLNLITEWENAEAVDAREAVHARLSGLRDVVKLLRIVAERGVHAQAELDKENARDTPKPSEE